MRTGQNPAKFIEEKPTQPERITVAILTHIPTLHGYHAEALEVLKVCLGSLFANTENVYDLLVFDNASGSETRAFLQSLSEAGRIDTLILSAENIGKGKAWDIIFSAAPGEIIAYADSDVYFEPGWLSEGIKLLETFPKVGMVSCRPMRTYAEGHTATIGWAEQDAEAEVSADKFMDWETFREHDHNLGHEESKVRERYESSEDFRIEYHGLQAYAGAAHWQFIAFKEVLGQFLPLGIERTLGDDRKLDDALNQAGYLRLMTTVPQVRHLGNRLPEDLRAKESAHFRKDGIDRSIGKQVLDWRPVRRFLLAVYNRIFHWYFQR
jgi:glycosyltransferase involved in cell wall biosynthesis